MIDKNHKKILKKEIKLRQIEKIHEKNKITKNYIKRETKQ